MKVYVLKELHCTAIGAFESILDIYLNEDRAIMNQCQLEQDNKDPNTSYYVHEMITKDAE